MTDTKHNNPPADANPLLDRLKEENADLFARADELFQAAERIPEKIESEEIAAKVGDQIRIMTACSKKLNEVRVAEKDFYHQTGKKIDAFFNPKKKFLDDKISQIRGRLNYYVQKKEQEERERREAEERRKREEAAEAARLAEQEKSIDSAVIAEQKQQEAEAASVKANASTADKTRIRSDYGAVVSGSKHTTFDELDMKKIDLEALRPYLDKTAVEKAIRAFIKDGGQSIIGARIHEAVRTSIR